MTSQLTLGHMMSHLHGPNKMGNLSEQTAYESNIPIWNFE